MMNFGFGNIADDYSEDTIASPEEGARIIGYRKGKIDASAGRPFDPTPPITVIASLSEYYEAGYVAGYKEVAGELVKDPPATEVGGKGAPFPEEKKPAAGWSPAAKVVAVAFFAVCFGGAYMMAGPR